VGVALTFVSFGKDDKAKFRERFRHLSIEEDGVTTSHKQETFDFDALTNAAKQHSNRFRALGKAQAKHNLNDLIDRMYQKSKLLIRQFYDLLRLSRLHL
jgi:hypothetical protein